MSYQQTRSTQDPPSYAQPFNGVILPLAGDGVITVPGIAISTQAGKPPTWETRIYRSTGVAALSQTIVYVPPSADERVLFRISLSMIGTSGAISGLVWSQEQIGYSHTQAGVTGANFISTAPSTTVGCFAYDSPAFNGVGLAMVGAGPNAIIIVTCGGAAGTCSTTVKLEITRVTM